MEKYAITPPHKGNRIFRIFRLRGGGDFGIIDAPNSSDAQGVFCEFLQAVWLGSQMA